MSNNLILIITACISALGAIIAASINAHDINFKIDLTKMSMKNLFSWFEKKENV